MRMCVCVGATFFSFVSFCARKQIGPIKKINKISIVVCANFSLLRSCGISIKFLRDFSFYLYKDESLMYNLYKHVGYT